MAWAITLSPVHLEALSFISTSHRGIMFIFTIHQCFISPFSKISFCLSLSLSHTHTHTHSFRTWFFFSFSQFGSFWSSAFFSQFYRIWVFFFFLGTWFFASFFTIQFFSQIIILSFKNRAFLSFKFFSSSFHIFFFSSPKLRFLSSFSTIYSHFSRFVFPLFSKFGSCFVFFKARVSFRCHFIL